MTTPALRESQAAVALICQWHDAQWKYLCQWSDTWRALHFIGGHREPGETFRDCALREALEELPIDPAEIAVADEPLGHLEYVTHSRSAGVPTFYVIEVFQAALSPIAVQFKVTPRPENHWVTREEIHAGRLGDGTLVSPTVELILTKLGL